MSEKMFLFVWFKMILFKLEKYNVWIEMNIKFKRVLSSSFDVIISSEATSNKEN